MIELQNTDSLLKDLNDIALLLYKGGQRMRSFNVVEAKKHLGTNLVGGYTIGQLVEAFGDNIRINLGVLELLEYSGSFNENRTLHFKDKI